MFHNEICFSGRSFFLLSERIGPSRPTFAAILENISLAQCARDTVTNNNSPSDPTYEGSVLPSHLKRKKKPKNGRNGIRLCSK